jgi:patatin-like phospholipase/acyl hydrolase
MKDIFDMFSGTSTGSIMSAGFSLSYKNETDGVYYPKYWGEEIRNIYIDNSSTIF